MLSYEIEAMLNLSDMSPAAGRSVGSRSFGDRSVTFKVRHRSSYDGDAARRGPVEEDDANAAEDALDLEPGCEQSSVPGAPSQLLAPRSQQSHTVTAGYEVAFGAFSCPLLRVSAPLRA